VTTSALRGAATAPGMPSASLPARVRIPGIIRRPGATLQAVAAAPRSADVLLITAFAAGTAGVLLGLTETGQIALVDQWERLAAAFGGHLTEDQYSRLWDLSRYAWLYAGIAGVLGSTILSSATALAIWAVPGAPVHKPALRPVLAIGAHAGIILALRQVIAAPIAFLRESTVNALSVGAWMPALDEGSVAAHALGFLDLFVVWWAVVLAIGMGQLYGRSPRRLAMTIVGMYATAGLIAAAAMTMMNPAS
jgi:hypothetical protein